MLTDPQSATLGGSAVSLPRTSQGTDANVYSSADGLWSLRVGKTISKTSTRFVISVQQNKIAADPVTAINSRKSAVVSVSITRPTDGFSATELKDLYAGLAGQLSATTYAVLLKVLGGEL